MCGIAKLLLVAVGVLASAAAGSGASKPVFISNTSPRVDVDGQILPVHDGTIVQWDRGGLYYWYGMQYGLCSEAPGNNGCSHGGSDPNCGFNTNHNVSLYTSPDLSNGSWTYAGDMLPVDARPEAIYYRPKIVFNPTTSRYVLWINAVPAGNFSASYYVVATSTVRTGPFVVQATHVALAQDAPGDFDIFVDDDDQGYIIYTAITAGHLMSVERLESSFLASTMQNSGFFGATFVEAPAMIKVNGTYLAFFGQCCCFCGQGSDIGTYAAPHPMGPWQALGDIGCQEKSASPWHPLSSPDAPCTAVTQAQQNFIFPLRDSDLNRTIYGWMWTGDRWQSAPDGIKDHDIQYWSPLQFVLKNGIPTPQSLRHLDNFTINIRQ